MSRTRAVALLLAVAVSTSASAATPPHPFQAAVDAAWERYRTLDEGKNADYIPALAKVDPRLFGVALVTVDGKVFQKGDVGSQFSIQSISKVFTLASVMETAGSTAVEEKIGVDATGQVFNSIVAIEQMRGKEMNPFVNPGAIATTSLVEGKTGEEKWARILAIHEAFAGRKLSIDEEVYRSEAATNDRNQAIAKLMHAYGRLYFDPAISTDVYTRQCSISVSASDLAVMAATLANGGKNPVTGKQAMSWENVPPLLAVMATAGLYDDSGIWLYRVGLPAKSGVGGGIIAVAPGRYGIAVFSPRLDAAGNSVRAQKVIRDIAIALRGNPYEVMPRKP
ncbi:MAG: glutaminase [Anaeromyxobacteraceae bacterium]|jgi:glutaminase|nr:glutaminase [Anaeromyxobacteraceae bacterium]